MRPVQKDGLALAALTFHRQAVATLLLMVIYIHFTEEEAGPAHAQVFLGNLDAEMGGEILHFHIL